MYKFSFFFCWKYKIYMTRKVTVLQSGVVTVSVPSTVFPVWTRDLICCQLLPGVSQGRETQDSGREQQNR